MSGDLTDEQLRVIYSWIDAIPLSRPKRNIARDFSDGVMLAELVAAYFPQLVEVHNYPAANSLKQKVYNHETLNKRVLRKFGYTIPKNTIEDIANCKAGAIESVLNVLQFKMAKFREKSSVMEVSPSNLKPHIPAQNIPSTSAESIQEVRKGGKASGNSNHAVMEEEILFEKEQQIRELQETVEILELKIAKLEQLVRLKDNKIQTLLNKDRL